jgi:hypothetical protein
MKYNTDPQFVGYERLKSKQREQLALFESWSPKNQWNNFHESHCDWWMFPIDEPSRFGYAWTVYEGDVAELKKDNVYIQNYLRGVELLALSWGWNLSKRERIANPHRDQKWQNWPIRLYKASKSLKLFGFSAEFESMRIFARDLMQKGENMTYDDRDLSLLFK